MKRRLAAAWCSLLVSMPALAAEPTASTATEPSAAAPAPATPAATSARPDDAAASKSRRESAADAANKTDASQVKQLQLKPSSERTVCRTEYPTGSRIGVKHCYSTAPTDSESSRVQNEIMRHDIQEMRDRQMYDQLRRASEGMTSTMRVPVGR